jgi:hypothetical protein
MNTPLFRSLFAARLALGCACLLTSVSCGGELLRTGRAPVYLVVANMQGQAGGGTNTAFLLSDVQVIRDGVANFFNDNAVATIRVVAKNPTVATTDINAVTLTRYRVVFLRSDGRNTPGVDVPYGIDGGLGVTISAGSQADVTFEIVRHQAKLEPPLRNLVGRGGLGFISTIAEITFFGRDQNGNDISVTGRLDVQFGDFADD